MNLKKNDKVINSMNSEIANCAKSILNKCVSELQNKTYQISTFLNFILAVHDKIYCNAESYISDPNEKMRNYYKMKIKPFTYEYEKKYNTDIEIIFLN